MYDNIATIAATAESNNMKEIAFHKFHGAGNDFVLIDNRTGQIRLTDGEIALCCHRHFGIGADGLILIESSDKADFAMRYFNADGKEATLCGNGSRCSVALAHHLRLIKRQCSFWASDGLHHATIEKHKKQDWLITIEMKDVPSVTDFQDGCFIDTGSPHFVVPCSEIDTLPVEKAGRQLRFDARFPCGTNVDFITWKDSQLQVRTYERGVEAETLSCGTGVTAAAMICAHRNHWDNGHYDIQVCTKGGNFIVSFDKTAPHYRHIRLTGPAHRSFSGIFCPHE